MTTGGSAFCCELQEAEDDGLRGFCKSLFREGRDFLESEDLRKEDKVRRHGLDRLFEHCTNVKIKIRVESVQPQGDKLQNIETVREALF